MSKKPPGQDDLEESFRKALVRLHQGIWDGTPSTAVMDEMVTAANVALVTRPSQWMKIVQAISDHDLRTRVIDRLSDIMYVNGMPLCELETKTFTQEERIAIFTAYSQFVPLIHPVES